MAQPGEVLDQPEFADPGMAHVGGFEALEQEHDYRVSADEIEGEIPEAVRGTFYHIGPGRNRIGGQTFGHWFDGDGMVHAITLDDSGVHYRNRFVRTPKYRAEIRAGRIVKRSIGHNAPGGILANMGRLPANCANTSLAWHAGRLLALWEGGRPWELDPSTLATRGEYDFGGRLGRFDAFSAHGKVDPETGCYFNHGLSISTRGPRLNLYRVNPEDMCPSAFIRAGWSVTRPSVHNTDSLAPGAAGWGLRPGLVCCLPVSSVGSGSSFRCSVMNLFFWKKNSKIDAFAMYIADDFYSHVHPDVAKEFVRGMPKDKKKTQRKVEQKLNAVIGAMQQFTKEESLGVYGKARLQKTFNDRLVELGYEGAVTRKLVEMILFKKTSRSSAQQ